MDGIKAAAIAEENYLRLCEKYGEKPQLSRDVQLEEYPNPYCKHARDLKDRERRENAEQK